MTYRNFLLFVLLTGLISSSAADKALNFKFGPYWPKALKHSPKKTALDLGIQSGYSVENKVSFGPAFDFIWSKRSDEIRIGPNLYKEEFQERTLMFPISFFLKLSPLSDLPVSPSFTGQIGLSFMHYKDKYAIPDELDLFVPYDENGWYFGPIYKLGIDILANIGRQVNIFGGTNYLWAKQKRIKRPSDNLFTRRNMSGWGLQFGIGLIL